MPLGFARHAGRNTRRAARSGGTRVRQHTDPWGEQAKRNAQRFLQGISHGAGGQGSTNSPIRNTGYWSLYRARQRSNRHRTSNGGGTVQANMRNGRSPWTEQADRRRAQNNNRRRYKPVKPPKSTRRGRRVIRQRARAVTRSRPRKNRQPSRVRRR